jgi:hypothetical protein
MVDTRVILLSQAIAWSLVVGHALNLVLEIRFLQHQYTASELRPRSLGKEIRRHAGPAVYRPGKSEVLTYD